MRALRQVLALAAVALISLGATSVAAAATIQVEGVGFDDSAMHFADNAGEVNDVSIALTSQSSTDTTYRITDEAAPVITGPGCTGGGQPGAPAYCALALSRGANCHVCSSTDPSITVDLGDGDDALDTTAVPATDGGTGTFSVELSGGPGADEIRTGPARFETIRPGPGPDVVRGGAGPEVVVTEATADGSDLYDLGSDGGEVDYEHRTAPLQLSLDGVANDGEAGEGDNLLSVSVVIAGSGPDELVGGPVNDYLVGRDGNDEILAGPGNDKTDGGGGSDVTWEGPGRDIGFDYSVGAEGDRFFGGPGDDLAATGPGDDLLFGGSGRDHLVSGRGDDRVDGGKQDDQLIAGLGADNLRGGGGDDRLGSGWDDDRDLVACGHGHDLAGLGESDVQSHCEVLRGRLFLR